MTRTVRYTAFVNLMNAYEVWRNINCDVHAVQQHSLSFVLVLAVIKIARIPPAFVISCFRLVKNCPFWVEIAGLP